MPARAPTTDRPLVLERLTYGPDALGHVDGHVIFVPYGAPGDVVSVRPVKHRRDYTRAVIDTVVSAGGARVPAACAAFGRCGGCQWQHVALAAQHVAKHAIVVEQLARIGGFRDVPVAPILAGRQALGYRSRITLVADGRRLGYHRPRTHTLEEISGCPLARPAVDDHVPTARRWASTLRMAFRRITIAEAPGGVVLVAHGSGAVGTHDAAVTEALLAADARVRGAVLLGTTDRVVVGDPTLAIAVESDLVLEVPADAFTQVNPEANLLLVRTVLDVAAFAAGDTVLDLYCGAGNLGLPLARRGMRVHGIERAPVAIAAGRANAARLGWPMTFSCASVADGLHAVTSPVDRVVLDPPRTGALDALSALSALRPRRIVYVSCDPPTLARDGRRLVDTGYALRSVQPLDLFPQTFHVECVAVLELT